MNSAEATEIIDIAISDGSVIEFFGEDDEEVKLDGIFTLEELQAIVQKMEYYD